MEGDIGFVDLRPTDPDRRRQGKHERIKDVAQRIISGEVETERLNDRGEQGRIRGGSRNVETSLLLRAGEGPDRGRQKAQEEGLV